MHKARRNWTWIVLVLALLSGALIGGSAPAQATDNPCGQTWPTTGSATTYKSDSADYYSVTFRFTLASAQLSALRCTGAYLELDARIRNFKNTVVYPAGWEDYTVDSNLPGKLHDVGFEDGQPWPWQTTENRDINPAVTRVYTSQLQAGVSYYVNFTWTLQAQSGKTPYVTFVWTPSHWANMSDPVQSASCAGGSFGNNTYPEGDSRNPNEAWCIFDVTNTAATLLGDIHFAGGFPAGQIPLTTGQYWYTFAPSSAESGITPPVGQPTQPPPSHPAAQMFTRGDSAVFARAGIGSTWTQETDPGNATKIASSSTGVQMFIRGDASVWAKRGIGFGGWSQETTPGNATQIAVGGETQMFLRGDGAVFATNCISCNWVQETAPGTATAIAASSNGTQMIITSDAAIWAKNGIGYGGWTQEVGPGNANAIAIGGDTQMFIRGDAAVFARTGIGTSWTQEASPGNANKIAASDTGVQMFIRGDAAVFARSGVGTSWTQAVGPGNAWAIAAGGNTELFARGDNALFATSCIGCVWTQETSPGNTAAIATG
jgi:hypothetical protein